MNENSIEIYLLLRDLLKEKEDYVWPELNHLKTVLQDLTNIALLKVNREVATQYLQIPNIKEVITVDISNMIDEDYIIKMFKLRKPFVADIGQDRIIMKYPLTNQEQFFEGEIKLKIENKVDNKDKTIRPTLYLLPKENGRFAFYLMHFQIISPKIAIIITTN